MKALTTISLRLVQLSDSRSSRPDVVNALAESMRESGLINPITVRRATVFDGAIMTDGFAVVAGNHRVSAARALGWNEIDAFVVDGDDDLKAELVAIDENLCRAELTAAERTAATKRRAEIWQSLHPGQQVEQVIPPVAKHGHAQMKSFAADTAASTGRSKQQINRDLARADALGDDLESVRGTSLDKGVELDALAKLEPKTRHALIEKAKAGERVTARDVDGDANVRRARQAVQALEVCAKYMDEGEMADALDGISVSGTVAAIAAVIAETVTA